MPEPTGFETGLYLLTPTHCGTGAASGAIDLPIARERHTDHPLLPATALKGVARDLLERKSSPGAEQVRELFGPPPPQPGQDPDRLSAGSLVFTDGRLLAFPVRSLQAAFYWVTCPLIVQRWRRARLALGLPVPRGEVQDDRAAATFVSETGLVLEDLALGFGDVQWDSAPLKEVALAWAGLIPSGDPTLRAQFQRRLVAVRDSDFGDLVRRCTPVNARVQLTPGKTTDDWTDPITGTSSSGNLWYEETLPSDCLFSALITTRSGKVDALRGARSLVQGAGLTQIGGNETVGQGLCFWSVEQEVTHGRR